MLSYYHQKRNQSPIFNYYDQSTIVEQVKNERLNNINYNDGSNFSNRISFVETGSFIVYGGYNGAYLISNYGTTITKLDVSDEVTNEINQFLDDYYDRYTGLYLKSKEFIKALRAL